MTSIETTPSHGFKIANLPEISNRDIPFGPLGEVTYLRTYSPFLRADQGGFERRETFEETVDRWTRYNVKLDPSLDGYEYQAELKFLREHALKLGVFPSGRTMWVGGREAGELSPQANFNCSFRVLDSFDAFGDVMELSMVGSGIGFSVEQRYIEKIKGLKKFKLILEDYQPLDKEERDDETKFTYLNDDPSLDHMVITIGDSRRGWIDALKGALHLASVSSKVRTITVNFNNIRDRNEPLRTFGGRASGPYPLFPLFRMIEEIARQQTETRYSDEDIQDAKERGALLPRLRKHRWTSIQALDLANSIGFCVVVGGVRRTAQIALGDSMDQAFATAKSNLYDLKTGSLRKPWRTCSNNSMMFFNKPKLNQIKKMLAVVRDNGEPGFINAAAAKRRRPNFKGLNPCAEILLDDKGVCNLSTVNLMAYVRDGKLNREELKEAFQSATRIGVRQTCVDITLEEWDKVQKRDRLVGVSMTGWMDMLDAIDKWQDKEWQKTLLQELRTVVHEEAANYSAVLGIPKPLLATTIKPEGTISKLPTVSSGLHPNMDEYYLQRIRIDSGDPLARVLREQGIPMEALIRDGVQPAMEDADTWVMEFPVKTPAKRSMYDYGAIEMLEQYKMFMQNYVDHNASNTIYVKDDEWDAVAEWLFNNWNEFVGISFMRFFDARTAPFPQMPWTPISREEYEGRSAALPQAVDMERLTELDRLSNLDDITLYEEACAGGNCPIR